MLERAIQLQIYAWWWWSAKRVGNSFLFAIPNGGLRNKKVAQKLKEEGVTAGVADLCLMVRGGRTVWIEVKRPKVGRMSRKQQEFKAACEHLGQTYFVVTSLGEFKEIFDQATLPLFHHEVSPCD